MILSGRRILAVLAGLELAWTAVPGVSWGEGTALLPDGHRLTLPAGMAELPKNPEETGLEAVWALEPDLEMLIFAYDAEGSTARSLAEALREAGREAQVREIGGTEFLAYTDRDETDGALCIGYACVSEGRMIEISFFCGSRAAAEMSREIMESYQ